MILTIYTLIHVVISIIGLISGYIVLAGMLSSKSCKCWTKTFLATTVLTSVTGFFFPVSHFMPSHAVGIISLVVLGLAIYALRSRRLAGPWRGTYVVTSIIALYLNTFVAIIQSFQKIPALKALAPKQTEPPFAITQLVVLGIFIVLGILATIKFRPAATDI